MKMFKDLINYIRGECQNWRHNFREIAYAVIIVLIINTFLIQNYQIPTGSMIPRLMPGDRLFANRFVYGVKIPFTDGFVDYRLPKIKSPKRGDLVVFRAPPSAYYGCERIPAYYTPSPLVQILKLPVYILSLSPFSWDPRILVMDKVGDMLTGGTHMSAAPSILGLKTVDLDPRKEYVKRVIAKSGDTVEIKEQKIYINGEIAEDKHAYFKYGKRDFVPPSSEGGQPIDNYGPVYVPKKGDVMIFKKLKDKVQYSDRASFEVYVNGEAANYDVKLWYWINIYVPNAKNEPDEFIYTVEEEYFFCLGDNRDESCDSRMWGLVPYRLIKGQPNIAWMQASREKDHEQGYMKYFFIR